jgi:hypothetical protein
MGTQPDPGTNPADPPGNPAPEPCDEVKHATTPAPKGDDGPPAEDDE